MSEDAPRAETATALDARPDRRRRLRSAGERSPFDGGRHDPLPWAELSRVLAHRREELGLSRREAARRAQVSEREWKLLESGTGVPRGSVRIMPNVSGAELDRIADALELDPDDLAHTLHQRTGSTAADPLCARIALLPPADRHLVEQLVERLSVEARSADRPE
jgi:transcriptional regulator with XRE-family HTH domain